MNIGRFVDLWIHSGLTSERRAIEVVAEFGAQYQASRAGTELVEDFCDFLVASSYLTEWQCSKLQMGKWKGFYLGHYLILEQIGKDHEFCYYAGRDTRDGTPVRLVITPIVRASGPGIEYRVERLSE